MRVVLVAMGPSTPGDGMVAGVQALRAAGHRVHLVTRRPAAPTLAEVLDGVTPLPPPLLPSRWAGRPLVAGRLRLDPDRLPGAVRVLRSRATREVLRTGEVLVAVDQAAIPAVWLAARRHRPRGALLGLPAAVARYR
jgi:hypothetical protein